MRVARSILILTAGIFILAATSVLTLCLAQEVLVAEVDIKPETLNPKSKGKFITCFVSAPEGYSAGDIIGESVIITDIGGNKVNIEPVRWKVTDSEDDGVTELMLKYSRAEVQASIVQDGLTGQVVFTIEGLLFDNTPFIGSDTVRVKKPK